MKAKAFCIFTSLCSSATVPYTLFKHFGKQNTQVTSESIRLVREDNSELQELDNFFKTYCRKVHEEMIVCKNRESFPWPDFYFVDNTEGSGEPQKIQSFIFQIVDKFPVLELELEEGKKKKIDGFSAGLGFEFFDKISLIPDSDCILLDNSAGGDMPKPNSIACKVNRDYWGGKWVNLPL